MCLVYECVFPCKKWCCVDSYQTCLSSTCYNNLRSRLKFSADPTSVLAARSSSNVQGKSKLIICFMFSLGQFSKYTIHAVHSVRPLNTSRASRANAGHEVTSSVFGRCSHRIYSRRSNPSVENNISGALDKAFFKSLIAMR